MSRQQHQVGKKTTPEVDAYLMKIPPHERAELQRIRQIVARIIPDAVEVISYGMPGFKYHGHYLMGYAAYKHHLSIYPTARPIELLREKLTQFSLSKGAIRFTVDNPIPRATVEQLILESLHSILERSNTPSL